MQHEVTDSEGRFVLGSTLYRLLIRVVRVMSSAQARALAWRRTRRAKQPAQGVPSRDEVTTGGARKVLARGRKSGAQKVFGGQKKKKFHQTLGKCCAMHEDGYTLSICPKSIKRRLTWCQLRPYLYVLCYLKLHLIVRICCVYAGQMLSTWIVYEEAPILLCTSDIPPSSI